MLPKHEAAALERQHGLAAGTLRAALRALQRWALSTTAAGRGARVPSIGRFVWLQDGASGGGGAAASAAASAAAAASERLAFEVSDALVRAGALRLGRGCARGVPAGGAARRGCAEEQPNHTQLAMR